MVSFAMGIGSLYGGMPTSMLQPRTTQPKKTTAAKSLVLPRGVTETSPGQFKDQRGNTLIKQGDQFYTLSTTADSAFGYISTPTLYKPPPEAKKERVEKKRVAVEQAVGSRAPIFEDLPQPEERPTSEQPRFRDELEEQRLRREQLKAFRGQRRSLLKPAARRPYYA